MSPVLRSVTVPDELAGWVEAGFTVDGGVVAIDPIAIRLDPSASRIAWTLDPAPPTPIDGLPSVLGDPSQRFRGQTAPRPAHPNGVTRIDHVVILSPDLGRTVPAFEAAGFEVRRRRDIGGDRQQVFWWAGDVILEMVGPIEGGDDADEPSRIWGLAVSVADLDAAAALLGERTSAPKDAVQPGRRISTLRTRELGITPAIALMSPHA